METFKWELRGYGNQIENKNPSGASQQDILNQANMLLAQDVKYKRDFKFDHIWPILKCMEKFTNNNGNAPGAFHEEGRNITSSLSFSVDPESLPSPEDDEEINRKLYFLERRSKFKFSCRNQSQAKFAIKEINRNPKSITS
ncbi:hypothetical protein YC2023_077517 [Brassica napus]